MTVARIEAAYKAEIKIWNEIDVNLSPSDCGLNASPTQVFRSFTPPPKGKGEMLAGTVPEMASALIAKLTEKHAL
jgi:electron transfer flavoprotein beta subunit